MLAAIQFDMPVEVMLKVRDLSLPVQGGFQTLERSWNDIFSSEKEVRSYLFQTSCQRNAQRSQNEILDVFRNITFAHSLGRRNALKH